MENDWRNDNDDDGDIDMINHSWPIGIIFETEIFIFNYGNK